jgi:transcriptional regulator with XRE-family HTH domain
MNLPADMLSTRNELLRAARQQRFWTLRDVAIEMARMAELLEDSAPGVDANAVSRWERGVVTPSLFNMRLLCLIFDMRPRKLGFPERPELIRDLETYREQLRQSSRTHK